MRKGFPDDSVLENPPDKQKMWIQSLGWEDSLKKEMATHSSMGNAMDREAWQTILRGVAKELSKTQWLNNNNNNRNMFQGHIAFD